MCSFGRRSSQVWSQYSLAVMTLHVMLPGSCNADALCCAAGPIDTPYGYGCFEFDM